MFYPSIIVMVFQIQCKKNIKMKKQEAEYLTYILQNGISASDFFAYLLKKNDLSKLIKDVENTNFIDFATTNFKLDAVSVDMLNMLKDIGISHADVFEFLIKKVDLKSIYDELVKKNEVKDDGDESKKEDESDSNREENELHVRKLYNF